MAADFILVVGGTAAGKTTYARRLADEIGGIGFSIDEGESATDRVRVEDGTRWAVRSADLHDGTAACRT